jgi:hypothetical protein
VKLKLKFIIECEPESTLLEGELKNTNSAFRKSWQSTVLPAFRALDGIKAITNAQVVEQGGTTVTLPVTAAGIHA